MSEDAEYEKEIYKMILFEALKSFISCTVVTHTTYRFVDLEYGVKEGCASFSDLNDIEISAEWENLMT